MERAGNFLGGLSGVSDSTKSEVGLTNSKVLAGIEGDDLGGKEEGGWERSSGVESGWRGERDADGGPSAGGWWPSSSPKNPTNTLRTACCSSHVMSSHWSSRKWAASRRLSHSVRADQARRAGS